MKSKGLISAIVLLSFSIGICYQASRYPFGTVSKIGPGFFPFYLSIALAALSFIILIRAILRGAEEVSPSATGSITKEKALRVILVLIFSLLYTWAMGRLGFPIATFLFIVGVFKFVESYSWFLSILGAVSISLSSYLLFGVWLQCQFPKGWLGI